MATNSVIRRVAQKETRLFFSSPVAWLFLGSFATVTLFVFFWVESFFARNIADVRPLFEWMPVLLIFLSAALTMRMWSDERRNGTLEHILTQPQGLWRFVLGKFRACFTLLFIALLCTLPLPITVEIIADLDWGPVVGGYLATLLLGGAYLSIGLYVSARTDNPIVSLIGTVILCGLFYFLGSTLLTDFFSDRVGEILRLLGSGSRFESISRGVLDARDLIYYIGLMLIFLSLNIYVLEKERWAQAVSTPRHRQWRTATVLLVANAVVANLWLGKIDTLRLDMTAGQQYSISPPTLELIQQLQEPLLIRGYFSAKTHPLLSPLVPQLRDLISEYEVAGKGKIRVEFIDPARHPELEQEANKRFGINATPFQVADRYQSALVNSYFNVMIQYGDEFETLGFADLIEVKTASNSPAEVLLRNPEFDLTRAIKRVLHSYQVSGNLFEGIADEVELIAYVSEDVLLPPELLEYKQSIQSQLQEVTQHANGKFSIRFIEPEANGGAVARQIRDEWGFKPMVAALSDDDEFFFYLTLADARQVVQLPTGNFDPGSFRPMLNAGLKRFAQGFTKTVALVVPRVDERMAKYKLGGPTFTNLEGAITRDYSIRLENLRDGSVTPEADVLVVAGPHALNEREVYAIDQYLMRGGTLILATSPYSAELSGGQIHMQEWSSGLEEWLAFQGINIGKSLVLDEQNATFPAPVKRQAGGYDFQDVRMVDYPFFIDLRAGGLSDQHPITSNLPQLTMAWASPVSIEQNGARRAITLLRSSPASWLSKDLDVMPSIGPGGMSTFSSGGTTGPRDLGVALSGRFDSWFAGKPNPLRDPDSDRPPDRSSLLGINNTIERSPESARIVVFASNDFLDDQILAAVVAASGTQYLGPLELLVNTLDWSLQNDKLLRIRSRGHFNRTLPPMQGDGQAILEYANYAMAILLLGLIATVHWLQIRNRRRFYASRLSL
jgi:ABC-2 type transport system permease protein